MGIPFLHSNGSWKSGGTDGIMGPLFRHYESQSPNSLILTDPGFRDRLISAETRGYLVNTNGNATARLNSARTTDSFSDGKRVDLLVSRSPVSANTLLPILPVCGGTTLLR